MMLHSKIEDKDLRQKIKTRVFAYGGNIKLKIYGRLDCLSGQRLKRENRVFFTSKDEALKKGYRPCGNCMREEYKKWILSIK